MQTFLVFLVLGFGPGAIYALLAEGIVLIFRGSRVLNFAQGALAMMATYLYLKLVALGCPKLLALVAIVAFASLGGAFIYFKVMRPLRHAPMLGLVVATLGLVLALQAAATLIFGAQPQPAPPLLPHATVTFFGARVGEDRLMLLVIAVMVAAVLAVVYRRTRFGLITRAAAENEKGASLLGYSPDKIAAINWALGTGLAALAGILISPIVAISPDAYTLLVIPALAAALLGRFTSFWITAGAAVGIGVAQSLVADYVTYPGVSDALPFAVIIIAMAVTGKLIPSRHAVISRRPPVATQARFGPIAVLVLAAATILVLVGLNSTYTPAIAIGAAVAIIGLSVVVVTGYAGQLSLMQMGFAGFGSFMISKIGHSLGVPFPFSIILAALCVVPLGLLVGLPALRVRGINLAIVTLGAGVALNAMLFQNPSLSGGYTGLPVDPPALFGYPLGSVLHPTRFAILSVVVLALCLLGMRFLRASNAGRRMLAVRDNERAATAAGVNVAATKLAAFGVSAFLAGLGGALLSMQTEIVAFTQFDPIASIFIVAAVFIAGIGSPGGALFNGIVTTGGLLYVFVSTNVSGLDQYTALISGIAVIMVTIQQPDGVIPGVARELSGLVRRRGTGRPGSPAETTGGTEPAPARMGTSAQPIG